MKTWLIFFFFCTSTYLFCTTLYVNLLVPSNPSNHIYHTISGADSAAVAGDIIEIYPGNYFESITVTKAITIRGNTMNSSRIITSNRVGITISANNVLIQNLHFSCVGSTGIISTGIQNVRNCVFDSCSVGITTGSGTLNLYNCIFRKCTTGVNLRGTIYGIIANSIFIQNATGLFMDNGSISGSFNWYLNTYNSIFINNTSRAIDRDTYLSNYYGTTAYNVIYGNTATNITLGTDNIDLDPLLGNTTGAPYYDYFPSSNSPCIDSGNPDSNYNDLDGSRNDRGIFGGPYQWGAGKPVILNVKLTPSSVQQGGSFSIETSGKTK